MRTPSRSPKRRSTGRPVSARASALAAEHERIAALKAQAAAGVEAAEATLPAEERKPVKPFSISYVRRVGDRNVNAMIYGPYGHGKTTFAASALDVPEMRDVLFINIESGDMSLTDRRSLDIVNVRKYDTIARVFEYLVKHCIWRDEGNVEKLLEQERWLKDDIVPITEQTAPVDLNRTWFEEQRIRTGKPMDEPYIYRTVIIDTLSEAHKYLVYKFTGIEIGKTKLTEDLERMEEWQEAQELFRLFIRSFRDLPMNVIFVCAEEVEPDTIGAGEKRKRNPRAGQSLPKLPGKMAGDVAGFIDIVGYLVREIEGGETSRVLYLGAGYGGWISKHRFVNLPDLEYVTNPTLSSIIDLARKDEELHGTSEARTDSERQPVEARRSTGPVSANSRRTAASARASGSRTGGRRAHNAVRRSR